jgi:hypothetical protein
MARVHKHEGVAEGSRPPEPVPVEQPKEQVDWGKYKRFMRGL